MQTVTVDYLTEDLKKVFEAVLDGQQIILKYRNLGEIILTHRKKGKIKKEMSQTQKEKRDKFLASLQKAIPESKLKQPSYKNNREMYDDLMSEYTK